MFHSHFLIPILHSHFLIPILHSHSVALLRREGPESIPLVSLLLRGPTTSWQIVKLTRGNTLHSHRSLTPLTHTPHSHLSIALSLQWFTTCSFTPPTLTSLLPNSAESGVRPFYKCRACRNRRWRTWSHRGWTQEKPSWPLIWSSFTLSPPLTKKRRKHNREGRTGTRQGSVSEMFCRCCCCCCWMWLCTSI